MNQFKTKLLNEAAVKDVAAHVDEWNKIIMPRDSTILILNELSLVYEYTRKELNNKIVYVSSTEEFVEEAKKRFPDVFSIYISGHNLRKIDKRLEMKIKPNSINYIIGNPPYDGDLFLEIAELLQPYLAKDGKEVILAPTACIDNPSYKLYINMYSKLFSHFERIEKVSDELCKTFDSYNGYSALGIYVFKKEEVGRDPRKIWKNRNDDNFVEIRKKLENMEMPTISDVVVRNRYEGIIVPIGQIGGGKRYLVYDKFKYSVNGACKIINKKDSKHGIVETVPLSKYSSFGVENGRINIGIPVKTEEEADLIWKLYRDNLILRGICVFSRGGGARIDYKMIPYFSCRNGMPTEMEIINALGLSDENVKYLKELGTYKK